MALWLEAEQSGKTVAFDILASDFICELIGELSMRQSITLNLPYDLSDGEWEKVLAVYREMDGWIEEEGCWFSSLDTPGCVDVSIEPSGLLISGDTDPLLFFGWVTKLCAKLTLSLQRHVFDAEM